MSEVWMNSRESIKRLVDALVGADEEARWDFGFWFAGLGLMATAIISQFGWIGLLFCFGAIIWKAGDHALKHS